MKWLSPHTCHCRPSKWIYSGTDFIAFVNSILFYCYVTIFLWWYSFILLYIFLKKHRRDSDDDVFWNRWRIKRSILCFFLFRKHFFAYFYCLPSSFILLIAYCRLSRSFSQIFVRSSHDNLGRWMIHKNMIHKVGCFWCFFWWCWFWWCGRVEL